MDSTTPTANFHPQMVQYTPADSSIETNVLALVSPSRSSVAFVRRKMRANLNLTSDAPNAPGPAAPRPYRKGRPGRTETHLGAGTDTHGNFNPLLPSWFAGNDSYRYHRFPWVSCVGAFKRKRAASCCMPDSACSPNAAPN